MELIAIIEVWMVMLLNALFVVLGNWTRNCPYKAGFDNHGEIEEELTTLSSLRDS